MKLQVGDLVRYLNSTGGGKVTRIINEKMVEILDESGFDLPVQMSELVLVDRPIVEPTTENVAKIPINVPDIEEVEGNDNPHMFLAFVRNAKKSNLFEMYVINDSNFHAMYVLASVGDDFCTRISSGLVEANTKIFVKEFPYEEIDSLQNIHLQSLFFKNESFDLQRVADEQIHINTVKFYKPGVFVVNDFFDEDAYVIEAYDAEKSAEVVEQQKVTLQNVDTDAIKNAMFEKEIAEPAKSQSNKRATKMEVDLHIHELVEDDSLLSNSEKLELQIKTFEQKLAEAVQGGYEKVVFIHGVGAGILKAKIRGILDRDYPQYMYQDASYQEYKFGATLVYLRKVYR